MRTKWEILEERRVRAALTVKTLTEEMVGMMLTELGSPCSGCGVFLATEADFARHFVIPDEHYLNLGVCPEKRSK